jgi:anti-anti-sigma regulatory factor
MTTTAETQRVNGENMAQALEEIGAKLSGTEGQVVLDFSGVRRIDPAGLRAFEDLATAADEKAVKIVLQGVNVDVYKVLKLARLTARFSFVN